MRTEGSFLLWSSHYCIYCTPHCKYTIPRSRKKYYQKRNGAASVPISTFMCLWTIYIFPWSVCLFFCRKMCGPILGIYKSLPDTWMRKLGLHKWDLRCSAHARDRALKNTEQVNNREHFLSIYSNCIQSYKGIWANWSNLPHWKNKQSQRRKKLAEKMNQIRNITINGKFKTVIE